MAAELERGRDLYASQAWMDAYESFAAADRSDRLGAEDLELMATSAYMVGREAEYVVLLERAHGAYLGSGHPLAARERYCSYCTSEFVCLASSD